MGVAGIEGGVEKRRGEKSGKSWQTGANSEGSGAIQGEKGTKSLQTKKGDGKTGKKEKGNPCLKF